MSDIKQAYQYCRRIAKNHYENFPVASMLLPRKLRPAVMVIYAFARSADDLADEGDLGTEERLAALADFERHLNVIKQGGAPEQELFIALQDVIRRHQLPIEPFYDLLSAFRQDVVKNRYEHIGELMEYCKRSANPVGRLMLQLFNQATPRNIALSDGICSALQLINFIQDIQQDYTENNRIYLPQEEMQRFHVKEMHIRAHLNDFAVKQLIDYQIDRARKMLKAGAPLGKALPGRLGIEVRMIVFAGTRVLYRLHKQENDYYSRPRLNLVDKLWVLWRTMLPK
jgi:squalene synthase HpnC